MIVLNWTAEYEADLTKHNNSGVYGWKWLVIRVNGEEVARQAVGWTRSRDYSDEPQMEDVMDVLKDLFRWEPS